MPGFHLKGIKSTVSRFGLSKTSLTVLYLAMKAWLLIACVIIRLAKQKAQFGTSVIEKEILVKALANLIDMQLGIVGTRKRSEGRHTSRCSVFELFEQFF